MKSELYKIILEINFKQSKLFIYNMLLSDKISGKPRVMQMDEALSKITTLMKHIYGKDISVYDDVFLRKTIERRLIETTKATIDEYLCCLEKDSYEAKTLYSYLQISFSQFFRDNVTFAALEQSILPGIIANKRNGNEIRIWSAGCANGQEAYSIAMLLSDIATSRGKEISFRIFATDISQEALSFGKAGTYDESMILEVKKKHLKKYFIKQDKNYTVTPELRKHVNFSTYDLLDQSTANLPDSIYGDFDIVMCSNVLIYYKANVQKDVIKKLRTATSPMGFLVTGESEKSLIQDVTKMEMITISTAVFQNTKRRFI